MLAPMFARSNIVYIFPYVNSNHGDSYFGVVAFLMILTFELTDDIQASNGFGQPAEDQVRLHVKRMNVFIVLDHFFLLQIQITATIPIRV